MSDSFPVRSHKGTYEVAFVRAPFQGLDATSLSDGHVVIDAKVAGLYGDALAPLSKARSVLTLEATEDAKSLERFPSYVESLMKGGLRRGHRIVAIGGGIIQDVCAFLASTVLRGVDWEFWPTTLLAQADSCIGSKSSINVGGYKNIVGTFHPPKRIVVSSGVLATLTDADVRSGVGEMIKVHALAGLGEFDRLAKAYDEIFTSDAKMLSFVKRSLELKRPLVEEDEFDAGPRLVLNYGHTFGHAIESATHFSVPHGIAVCFGMDMANHIAADLGFADRSYQDAMASTLRRNTRGFDVRGIDIDAYMSALLKDKKHTADALRVVLPSTDGRIRVTSVANDDAFKNACKRYFERG